MKQNLPIRIEEHNLPDSSKIVKEIIKASHETKQRWFGLEDSEPENFNSRLLMGKLISIRKKGYELKKSFNELSPHFQRKADNHYDSFLKYNIKIFSALDSANNLNFTNN